MFSTKPFFYYFWRTCGIALTFLFISKPAYTQVIPDATLPNNSKVMLQGNTNSINGGTTAGRNLFHSFSEFSVPTKGVVYFNNTSDIQNIISRVTGSSVSNIDGLIKANGSANLFLINPNGIIFGPNAQLNIGGSFLASTASSINFADGKQFSATAPQAPPLLTISIPVGLQFGSLSGSINVQGIGNSLVNPIYSPIIRESSFTGLSVQRGKTLALVGDGVNLNGGILTVPGGKIELGSVSNGLVSISPTTSGWTLGYQGVSNFRDIYLSQQALVDTSGEPSGFIHIQGLHVALTDGSTVFAQNQGNQSSGSISVNALESLVINGTSPDGRIASTLLTETVATGRGGDITVSTKKLIVQDGGQILPRTFSIATGGNLTINASDSIQVIGFSPAFPNLFSNISAATFGPGDAGRLTLSTGNLTGINGIQIGSATFGSGSGGDVTVNARNITLSGVVPNILTPSTINAATFKNGKAGEVIVNTSNLTLQNGGAVASSTTASGSAGSVTVNASSVSIDGVGPNSITPSLVDSSAIVLASPLQRELRIPSLPSGNSGNVTINTNKLSITNGGLANVQNEGPGKAGTLRINARSIFLDNKSGITASAASGNGGDININTQLLTVLPNSTISANALGGTGGRVIINAQGIFAQPGSITAVGKEPQFNGTIQINIPAQLNFARASANPTPQIQSPQVESVCQSKTTATGSQFIIMGSGGLPANPSATLNSNSGWQDHSLLSPNQDARKTRWDEDQPIEEAQGWIRRPNGVISLVTELPGVVPDNSLNTPACSALSSQK